MDVRRCIGGALLCALLGGAPVMAAAAEIRVAVAANFKQTLERLGAAYARDTKLIISAGATGMLYGQITQGAPYDVFFAADRERPEKLEAQGLSVKGSRFAYANGKLVFWSPRKAANDTLESALRTAKIVAIAHPQLAPYGVAAQQVLEHLKLWSQPPFRIVRGESLGQTFQFVASANADAGFVSLAQMYESQPQIGRNLREEIIAIDARLYAPIEQQVVQLKAARDPQAAAAFLAFVRSEAGRRIIAEAGYEIPH